MKVLQYEATQANFNKKTLENSNLGNNLYDDYDELFLWYG